MSQKKKKRLTERGLTGINIEDGRHFVRYTNKPRLFANYLPQFNNTSKPCDMFNDGNNNNFNKNEK